MRPARACCLSLLLAAGCATPSAAIEAPFDFARQQVLIEGAIGGERLRFLVDTGATPSAIDLATAERTGLAVDRRRSGLASGAGDDEVPIYASGIEGLRIGGREIGTVEAVAVDLGAVSGRYGAPVHGVLGWSFLSGRVVRFDYARRRLLLDPPGPACPAEGLQARYPFDPAQAPPRIEGLRINGREASATIDTGSSLGLQVFAQAAGRLGVEPLPGASVAALGARGAYALTPAREAVLGIGRWSAPVETVLSPAIADDAQRDVNLGNAALGAFVMTLDYRNGVLCLNASPAQTD